MDRALLTGIAVFVAIRGAALLAPERSSSEETGVAGAAEPEQRRVPAASRPVLNNRGGGDLGACLGVVMRDDPWEGLPTLNALDLEDAGSEFLVTLSLARTRLKDVHVRLDGTVLTVQARRDGADGIGSWNLVRRVMLPAPADPGRPPQAQVTNGLLLVRVPKHAVE